MAAGAADAPGVPPRSNATDAETGPPPELTEAAREIARATLETGRSAWAVTHALRRLLSADVALTRSALASMLFFVGAATAFGASAWLLLMASLVLLLQALGMSSLLAIAIPLVLSTLGAGVCALIAARRFSDTGFDATRRQFARLRDQFESEHERNTGDAA
jgi:hypothetical protein